MTTIKDLIINLKEKNRERRYQKSIGTFNFFESLYNYSVSQKSNLDIKPMEMVKFAHKLVKCIDYLLKFEDKNTYLLVESLNHKIDFYLEESARYRKEHLDKSRKSQIYHVKF